MVKVDRGHRDVLAERGHTGQVASSLASQDSRDSSDAGAEAVPAARMTENLPY
jgi:hypothetical protein